MTFSQLRNGSDHRDDGAQEAWASTKRLARTLQTKFNDGKIAFLGRPSDAGSERFSATKFFVGRFGHTSDCRLSSSRPTRLWRLIQGGYPFECAVRCSGSWRGCSFLQEPLPELTLKRGPQKLYSTSIEIWGTFLPPIRASKLCSRLGGYSRRSSNSGCSKSHLSRSASTCLVSRPKMICRCIILNCPLR
jgi:hypothetical protein